MKFHKLTAFLTVVCILLCLCSCKKEVQKTEKTLFAMDTYMTFTVYGENSEKTAEKCIDEIKRLDSLLSAENEESEISFINSQSECKLSDELADIIEKSLELSRATDGAFDITVGALTKLWGFSGGEYRLPSDKEISAALETVGYEKISLEGGTLKKSADTKLDLGAVAKGYATDRLFEILKEQNPEGAVVSLGGNVLTFGQNPSGKAWKVAVTDPENRNNSVKTIERNGSFAFVTSGDYQRFFEQDGKKYHHILNPKTGYPAESGLSSVTVVCKNGFYADGLSTAIFVSGKEKAPEFSKNTDEFDVVFIGSDGEVSEQSCG